MTGPTTTTVVRSARGPVLVVVALVVTALLAVAVLGTAATGQLDPRAYDPAGSRAIAALLEDRGVEVRVATTVEAVSSGPDSTVLVPFPEGLSSAELSALRRLPGSLVVIGAAGPTLAALDVDTDDSGPVQVEARRPACDLPAAERAGDVELGGPTYRVTSESIGCYASGGRATLLVLPNERVSLLGSGELLTNARLDERGNAALALGLLGSGTDVQWLLPRPGARDAMTDRSLNDLLPDAVKLAALQLLIAAAALALWRSRRLGPVVREPLPVVVRAAESVEGRSRLYRSARSRGTAAEALRAGARDRLVRRLGLPTDTGRAGLVDAVSARISREPAGLDALLYGAEPGDDAALVRLADDLDTLNREVAGS